MRISFRRSWPRSARRYSELARYDEAQRALVRYIGFSPDHWAYDQLAKNYKERGDLAHWQSTLEEFLAKTEDHGLTHASVNVQLANHFMALKKREQAEHYAEAAARSGAGWAMMCAAEYAEGGETGRPGPDGSSSASEPAAAIFSPPARLPRSVSNRTTSPDDDKPAMIGYFYWLSGDTKKAMAWFRKAYEKAPTPKRDST